MREGAENDPSVLLVDTEGQVGGALAAHVERETELRVATETHIPAALHRLTTTPVSCLVVDVDPLDDAGLQFVTDARRIAPDCPVVVLTELGPEGMPADLRSHATTVVTRGDEANRGFVVEKVRSAVRDTATRRSGHEMYRSLVETARDGLYRLNANGTLVYANESFAEMLGYDREELLGEHGSLAMVDGELERGQRVIQAVIEADDRESDIVDLEMETKDGDRITVSIHFAVLTTDDGAYDGVMGVVRDVTDRRERERELERKNERLEEFANIVSHDLRNPLEVAIGGVELARRECDSPYLDQVEDAHDRIGTLIDDLLTIAREGDRSLDVENLDLAAVAEACWETVATGDATLVTDTGRTVRADRGQLRQLLENLMRNSVEHGSTGSQPSAGDSVEHSSTGDRPGADHSVEHGGKDVTVRVGKLADGFYVEDDGPGIPEEERDRVFESGYSSRAEGTGFGLEIVRQVADAHGWTVDLTESEAGGARFEVTGVE